MLPCSTVGLSNKVCLRTESVSADEGDSDFQQ